MTECGVSGGIALPRAGLGHTDGGILAWIGICISLVARTRTSRNWEFPRSTAGKKNLNYYMTDDVQI